MCTTNVANICIFFLFNGFYDSFNSFCSNWFFTSVSILKYNKNFQRSGFDKGDGKGSDDSERTSMDNNCVYSYISEYIF